MVQSLGFRDYRCCSIHRLEFPIRKFDEEKINKERERETRLERDVDFG